MSATVHRPRPRTAGRSSHLVGALADVALLVVINVSPGWQAVPVLTDAARGGGRHLAGHRARHQPSERFSSWFGCVGRQGFSLITGR